MIRVDSTPQKHHLECFDCNHSFIEDDYYITCPECGGFIEVALDTDPALRRFRPENPSIFRFEDFMPYVYGPSLAEYESISETPEFVDDAISSAVGVEVIVKDETVLPTGTWKDKEGFLSIHRLLLSGIDDLFVFSSGNTGTAIARSASIIRGPRIHMVLPKASENRVSNLAEFYDPDFVSVRFFDGSNDECIAEAARLAREMGIPAEGGFANYARREGIKLFALEHIFNPAARDPDWYAQPIAGGIGIYSYWKAARDAGVEPPRMLGVQADICAPMVHAWEEGADRLEERHIPKEVIPSPFVRVLRTRNPGDAYRILKRIMDEVEGAFNAVSGEEIQTALKLYYRSEYFRRRLTEDGVLVGLEAATVLAGVVKAVQSGVIERGSSVLLCVSGAAKEGDVRTEWVGL